MLFAIWGGVLLGVLPGTPAGLVAGAPVRRARRVCCARRWWPGPTGAAARLRLSSLDSQARARPRRAHRDLRLRGRRAHRRAGGHRPAARRTRRLRRRHRARPVRPAAHRRDPPPRPRAGRRAHGPRDQGARRGLQQRVGRVPRRHPRALPRAGRRGDPARGAPGRRRHPHRAHRRDRHPRHHRVGRLPGHVRRGARRRGHGGGVPALRGLRRARHDQRAADPGHRAVATSRRCRRRGSTPSCSAARTTRCWPGSCRSCSGRTSRSCPAPTRRPRTSCACSWPATSPATRRAPPPAPHEFLATGDPEPFRRLGRRFLGPEIGAVAGLGVAAG